MKRARHGSYQVPSQALVRAHAVLQILGELAKYVWLRLPIIKHPYCNSLHIRPGSFKNLIGYVRCCLHFWHMFVAVLLN
jgi:hypothetical protein